MNTALANGLYEAGLIQFGRFAQPDGMFAPMQFQLGMLASYPPLLHAIATEFTPLVEGADRLLCRAKTLPLGVAVALQTGIPLVYSAEGGQETVFDLVGAYDIGHKTAYLTYTSDLDNHDEQLIAAARRVGLEVSAVYALIETRYDAEYPFASVLRLAECITMWVEQGMLPSSLGTSALAAMGI